MEADILAPHFQDEEKARGFLEPKRWPDCVVCPHCSVIGESFPLEATNKRETHVRKSVWEVRRLP